MRMQLLLLALGGIMLGLAMATAHDVTTASPDDTTAADTETTTHCPDPVDTTPETPNPPTPPASVLPTVPPTPGIAPTTPPGETYLQSPSSCTSNMSCSTRVVFSYCDTTVKRCGCIENFAPRDGICKMKNYLHEECKLDLSWCVTENSECREDPDNPGSYKCQCEEGCPLSVENSCDPPTTPGTIEPTTASGPNAPSTTMSTIEPTTRSDYIDPRFFTSPDVCNNDRQCGKERLFSICMKHIMTLNGVEVVKKQCICDEEDHYFRHVDKCYMHAKVTDVCSEDAAKCTEANAKCMDDGTNSGIHRCRCKPGFIYMEVEDSQNVCAQKIHKDIDEECALCEANDGICYDSNNDEKKDGCNCPISLSGPDCTVTHVDVNCNLDTFTMTICYTPHEHLKNTSVSMFAFKKGTDEACKGKLLANDTNSCVKNAYELMLPMKESERKRCGTDKLIINKVKKFENTLVVRETGGKPGSQLLFKTYCSFKLEADTSFDGVNINGMNMNDRGVHQDPTIFLIVENHLREVLAERTTIQINDKIRFRIEVEEDDIYTAMRILHCTASNKPAMPDPKASTKPLTLNGCPYKGSKIFDLSNNWRYYSKPTAMETGLFPMFSFASGDSVYMHCSIKLCVKGFEADCKQPNCTEPMGGANGGGARKKRATESDEVSVTRELHVSPASRTSGGLIGTKDKTATGNEVITIGTSAFAVLIALLVVMVILSVTITAFMYTRLRRRKSVSGEIGENRDQRPQRFGMPRIGRSHQRM